MTPKELKLWKKYRASVDKLNAEIQRENSERLTNYLCTKSSMRPSIAPIYRATIEPSIVGFYDFISGYTKKEVKK